MSDTRPPIKAITTPIRLEYDFSAGQAATLFRMLVSKGHRDLDGIAVLKLYDGNEQL